MKANPYAELFSNYFKKLRSEVERLCSDAVNMIGYGSPPSRGSSPYEHLIDRMSMTDT